MPKTLKEIGLSIPNHSKSEGSIIDYLPIYDEYFSKFRDKEIKFLEIGVGRGGSLKIWKEYFPNANIYGMDTPDWRKTPMYNHVQNEERIKIFLGYQEDINSAKKIVDEIGKFDIIIDDGGHQMYQQINSLKNWFQFINKGGLYIVEDLGTSYWSQFGGKYGSSNTTISFLKNLVDNLQPICASFSNTPTEEEFVKYNREYICGEPVPTINSTLKFLHFYNCLAILGKK